MKKRNVFLAILSATVLAMFAGCTTHHGNFTVISTRNIDWSRAHEFVRSSDRVEGRDIVHIIILFPTGTPSMFAAVDAALAQVPGAVALVDSAIRSFGWYIPWIYGQQGWIIEGSVLIDPLLASVDMHSTTYLVLHVNESGDVTKREVCEDEFLRLANRPS